MGQAVPDTSLFIGVSSNNRQAQPELQMEGNPTFDERCPDAASSGPLGAMADWIADFGGVLIDSVVGLGNVALFCLRTAGWLFGRLPRRETIIPNFYQIGVLSLPVIALTGTFIGMVLVVQSYVQFRNMHLEAKLGAVINMSLVRELGPVLAATMLAGRVGSAMAAELGTMVVSEEVDALRVMALNPVRFLVVPRLLATIIMTVLLSIIADLVMIVSGWLTSVNLGIDSDVYYHLTWTSMNITGFVTGLVKAGVYGMLIGLIACYLGLSVKPWEGSEGVGRATTQTVVFSIVAIIGAAAIFTAIFFAYGLFEAV